MLETYHKRHPKPKTIVELKEVYEGDLGQPTSGTTQLARHVVATWCICGIYVGVYGTLMPRSYT